MTATNPHARAPDKGLGTFWHILPGAETETGGAARDRGTNRPATAGTRVLPGRSPRTALHQNRLRSKGSEGGGGLLVGVSISPHEIRPPKSPG